MMKRGWSRMAKRPFPIRKLLCVVVTVSVVVFLLNIWHVRTISKIGEVVDVFEYMFDKGIQTGQEQVDYIAKNLDVKWIVEKNHHTYAKHIVSLTNTGRQTISGTNWKICFHHIRILEPVMEEVDDRHRHNVSIEPTGMRITHLSGLLYCIFPDEKLFEPLRPNQQLNLPITSSHFQLSKTDCFPNWYVVAPGTKPRTILSTEGESLRFVSTFDHPEQWKRSDQDEHNPYNATDRYFKSKDTVDLKKAGKLIIPTPEEILILSNDPVMIDPSKWVILNSQEFPSETSYLADKLGMKIVSDAPSDKYIKITNGDIVFSKKTDDVSEEAYEMRISAKPPKVDIKATTGHGVFNAIQSLLNVAEEIPEKDYRTVPSILVKDRPRFKYRGYMVDISRNFHEKGTIFKLLDMMAMYKLNKLHLHLTDDDGWRIEIPDIPELTMLGSRRCHDETEKMCLLPSLGSGPWMHQLGTGYYSIKDYKEILQYAKLRHIQIIPEIDMPGHMRAALKSIQLRQINHPEERDRYQMIDKADGNNYRTAQGYNDNCANPCREGLYRFVEKVVQTLVEAHKEIQPLTMFHYGGDEVPKRALQDMKCSSNKSDINHYFIQRIFGNPKFTDLSYAAWEDGLLHDKQPYSIQSLNSTKRDIYAFVWTEHNRALFRVANEGYKVINCRGAFLYFDHPYEPDPEERGLYWATRYIHTKDVFKFNPLKGKEGYGPLLKPENIIGIQAQLWTELIRTTEQFDYMTFPRLLALAERAWHQPPWETSGSPSQMERDWIEFVNTLGYREFPKLEKLDVKYRLSPPGAIIKEGKLLVSSEFPGLPVEYRIDRKGEQVWNRLKGRETITEPIVLRTRSHDGKRYSREVKVHP